MLSFIVGICRNLRFGDTSSTSDMSVPSGWLIDLVPLCYFLSACLSLLIALNKVTQLPIAYELRQEPRPALSLINPVLNSARSCQLSVVATKFP